MKEFFKRLFCGHKEQEIVSYNYFPPFKGTLKNFDISQFEYLCYGFTCSTYKCTKCGKTFSNRSLGDCRAELELDFIKQREEGTK